MNNNNPTPHNISDIEKMFDNKFLHKTFDSYQGWNMEDLEEVEEFLRTSLTSLLESLKREENLDDNGEMEFTNGFNTATSAHNERINKAMK